jgi:hypothetical protein
MRSKFRRKYPGHGADMSIVPAGTASMTSLALKISSRLELPTKGSDPHSQRVVLQLEASRPRSILYPVLSRPSIAPLFFAHNHIGLDVIFVTENVDTLWAW